jgi:PAS domain S-box-containing protein
MSQTSAVRMAARAWERARSTTASAPEAPPHPTSGRLRAAVDAVQRALVATDEVWRGDTLDGDDSVQAIEASYALHRAALALQHVRLVGDGASAHAQAGSTGAAPPRRSATDRPWSLLIDAVEEYAIFQLTPDGDVATWNAGARRIKGYAAEEILGRSFRVFYTAADVAAGKPTAELAHAVAYGRCRDEGWRVRKDGTTFWANVVITALFDDNGILEGFAKVTRDETDRRRVDGMLRAAELSAERERIGVEMTETTVREIFEAGLILDAISTLNHDPAVADRLRAVSDRLDRTITGIRTAVLDLDPGHPAPS